MGWYYHPSPPMSKILEIGPGRGDFLIWMAQTHPEDQFYGVELKIKRNEKLRKRIESRHLTNVDLILGDARQVLPQRFEDESVDDIYILYSDPWPKRRHAKNRLFEPAFVHQLRRILRPLGRVLVAHDDPDYLFQIRRSFSPFGADFLEVEEPFVLPTFYGEKWQGEGRSLRAFSYKKLGCREETDPLPSPKIWVQQQ